MKKRDVLSKSFAAFLAVMGFLLVLTACSLEEPLDQPGDVNSKDDKAMGMGFERPPIQSQQANTLAVIKDVPADGPRTFGIDVSKWQGSINWTSVKNAGVQYAVIRVSYGSGYFDPYFDANWGGAQSAGVLRGAYQYYRPSQDWKAQADLFLAHVSLGPNDLPPVIDVEETEGVAGQTIVNDVKAWCNYVKTATGKTPIIYTSPYFWDSLPNTYVLSDTYLWVAHWGSSTPSIPDTWNRWELHQDSETGSVSGISGNVDTDWFNGDMTRLAEFCNGGSGGPGSHAEPYEIEGFPYTHSDSTVGAEQIWNDYLPLSSANESGPEKIYHFKVSSPGALTVSVDDGAGYTVDIDVHLLSSMDNGSAIARHDSGFTVDIQAGDYYIVCDTYQSASKAGSYTLNASFVKQAVPGSHEIPFEINTFPYSKSSTTVGKEKIFNNYLPLSSADESGPEEVYEVLITEAGTLTVAMNDGSDYSVDIDVHLLSSLNSADCVMRHDSGFSYDVQPGIYYIICDTYQSDYKAGSYILNVSFEKTVTEKIIFSEKFDGNTTLSGWNRSDSTYPTYYKGTTKVGTAALRIRYNGWVYTSIDTRGYKDITVEFKMAAYSLESGENMQAWYHTGTGWVEGARISDGQDNSVYRDFSIDMPASADNNASLLLGYIMFASSSYDYGYIDEIVVRGFVQ